jgi:tellurite resistance protein
MDSATHTPYSDRQITAWLRGLLTLAWADGHFEAEEQALIIALTRDGLDPSFRVETFEPIEATLLAQELGSDPILGETFLRTAVMVALADGIYSPAEDQMLRQFCNALQLDDTVLKSLQLTLQDLGSSEPQMVPTASLAPGLVDPHAADPGLDLLKPVRLWLDGLDIKDVRLARFLCRMIPSQCPFERNITLFGKKTIHIPPLCKLNPLYDQLVGLRFRSLSYLADDCGEDVSPYC